MPISDPRDINAEGRTGGTSAISAWVAELKARDAKAREVQEQKDRTQEVLNTIGGPINGTYAPAIGVPPTPKPCPSCGHCPTCGRGGHTTYPYAPNYPHYPRIWYGTSAGELSDSLSETT